MPNEFTPEDVQALRSALENVVSDQAFVTSMHMLETARQNSQSGNYTATIALCERIVELNDPYFVQEALSMVVDTWRLAGNHEREAEAYEAIARLPNSFKKFANPLRLGIALSRSGHLEEAKQHYLNSLELFPYNVSIYSNLTELLLIMSDYAGCIEHADRLVNLPSTKYQIVGRLLKGSALYLQGSQDQAGEQFKWLGDFLISSNFKPSDLSWDFSDARTALNNVKLASASLVIQTLEGRLSTDDLAARWSAMFPPQTLQSANPETTATAPSRSLPQI